MSSIWSQTRSTMSPAATGPVCPAVHSSSLVRSRLKNLFSRLPLKSCITGVISLPTLQLTPKEAGAASQHSTNGAPPAADPLDSWYENEKNQAISDYSTEIAKTKKINHSELEKKFKFYLAKGGCIYSQDMVSDEI